MNGYFLFWRKLRTRTQYPCNPPPPPGERRALAGEIARGTGGTICLCLGFDARNIDLDAGPAGQTYPQSPTALPRPQFLLPCPMVTVQWGKFNRPIKALPGTDTSVPLPIYRVSKGRMTPRYVGPPVMQYVVSGSTILLVDCCLPMLLHPPCACCVCPSRYDKSRSSQGVYFVC